jgi:hypothetical protein
MLDMAGAPTTALIAGDGSSWVRPGEVRVATLSSTVERGEARAWSP